MKNEAVNTQLTIITIPESFVHIGTEMNQKVTAEMYGFIQGHIEQNTFNHAILTALYHYVHDFHADREAVDLDSLEVKMDKILQLLNGQKITIQTVSPPASLPHAASSGSRTENAPVKGDLLGHLDELLEEFGG